MSLHLRFLIAIDRLSSLATPVLATMLGRDCSQFLQRGWVTAEGHLTHVMAPFLDSECEVEIETDLDPSLIGGALIDAGDVVIDGSLRGKLDRLQAVLAS